MSAAELITLKAKYQLEFGGLSLSESLAFDFVERNPILVARYERRLGRMLSASELASVERAFYRPTPEQRAETKKDLRGLLKNGEFHITAL